MPILELTICEWHDARVTETVLEQPRWEAVEQAIRALNNKERNDLYLTPTPADPEAYLCVGEAVAATSSLGQYEARHFPRSSTTRGRRNHLCALRSAGKRENTLRRRSWIWRRR
jgi:hypothetical protein